MKKEHLSQAQKRANGPAPKVDVEGKRKVYASKNEDFSYEEAKRMLKLIKTFESMAMRLK